MSRFEIHCPGCNVPLRVSSEWLGKKGRCRRCGALFPIHRQEDLVAGEVFDPSQTVLGWLGAPTEPVARARDVVSTVRPRAETRSRPVLAAASGDAFGGDVLGEAGPG